MYNFILNNPTKIYFGDEWYNSIGNVIKEYGSRVMIVYGGNSVKQIGILEKIEHILIKNNIHFIRFGGVETNPRTSKVNSGSIICRNEGIDVILAIGGGKVIDCAKAISIGYFYEGDCWDIIMKKVQVSRALPIIAIPTIAGTGSEMNNTCVISNEKMRMKRGFSNELLQPKVSFLDPQLTYSVNEFQTACGAVDILSHVLDTTYLVSGRKMDMLNDIMESICRTVIRYSVIAIEEPKNYEARANLMWASTWALNGFLKNGVKQLASCHAIEHELSAFYDITHGLGMAIVMPRYYDNIITTQNAHYFEGLAKNVFCVEKDLNSLQAAQEMIGKMKEFFFNTLHLPSSLSELGIGEEEFENMANNICWGQTLPGLEVLSVGDVVKILKECL